MAKAPNITTAPTGQIAPFGLRMLPELRAQIEEAAKTSGRSMNAEIVARLAQSFEPAVTPGFPRVIAKMEEAIAQAEGEVFHQKALLANLALSTMQLTSAAAKGEMAFPREELEQWHSDGREALVEALTSFDTGGADPTSEQLSRRKFFKENRAYMKETMGFDVDLEIKAIQERALNAFGLTLEDYSPGERLFAEGEVPKNSQRTRAIERVKAKAKK